jgi:hypothetical protein
LIKERKDGGDVALGEGSVHSLDAGEVVSHEKAGANDA